jgi:peptidoglycan/xylan/chitin deacetylase (PgdA/CDA1 family)
MLNLADRLTADGSLTIFLFHGVVARFDWRIRNYTAKHVQASVFRDSLDSLAHAGEPLSMDQVVAICRSRRAFPKGAFAITFDDGFENNWSIARPILEELKLPATIYVTTRFVDENGMSWIDRIEWALEHTSAGTLQLPWSSGPVQFGDDDGKIRLLNDIRQNVKTNSALDSEALVSDIFRQLDLEEVRSSDSPLDKKLSWQQVRDWLAPGYLVGGHSHSHPILSFLSPEKLSWELDTSLRLLRERADITPSHYSYPEGLAHCYSQDVILALKSRGITCSPTAIDGVNPPGSDPFHLRRVMGI